VPDSARYLCAGAVATFFHDSLMTPAEVVKQRMQMCCSPYKSCTDAARVGRLLASCIKYINTNPQIQHQIHTYSIKSTNTAATA
jgi:hypothetical protein